MLDLMRGREAGQAAETDGAEKAVTGRIAAGTGPAREPGRCAAARKQIRDWLSAGSQDAAVNVDHEATLGMKQPRHDTTDIKRADKRSEREVTPAEPIRMHTACRLVVNVYGSRDSRWI
jgi:hypothetical protein